MLDFNEMFKEERKKLVRSIEHRQNQKEMFEDMAHNQNLKLIEAQNKLNEFDNVIRIINNLPS